MRMHKIICKACYDNGKKIKIISESEIINHYNNEQKKYLEYKKKKKNSKRFVTRYQHDVNNFQLFYEMDNDKKPIIKYKVSRNVLGKVISYKDARYGISSCNYRNNSYFRKEQIRKDKRLQLLTTLPSIAKEEPESESESDEDDVTVMDVMIQALKGEQEVKEICSNPIKNDTNENSNVMNLLMDQARIRQQQIDKIAEEKDSIVTTVTADSIITAIANDPTNLDKIILQELSQMKQAMDEVKLKHELSCVCKEQHVKTLL